MTTSFPERDGPARLAAEGVRVRLGGQPVLDGVDVRVASGEVLGVVGPNGSGKSTLLRVLYGAQSVADGSVMLGGRPLAGWSRREIARQIAVVAQDPPPELPLRVGEAVLLGRLPHVSGFARWRAEDRRAAAAAMAATGIGHLVDRLVTTLSGGERQRLLIARALAQGTDLVLWDEPTNHLDLRHAHDGLGLLRDAGLCGIVVLHDLNLAARYCDRLVVLDKGRVVASGPPDVVCRSELIAAVFGVATTVVDHCGSIQLLFSRVRNAPGTAGLSRTT